MFPSPIRERVLEDALSVARRLLQAGYREEAFTLLAEIVAAGAWSPSLLPIARHAGLNLEELAPTATRILDRLSRTRRIAAIARGVTAIESVLGIREIHLGALDFEGLDLLRAGVVQGVALLGRQFGRPLYEPAWIEIELAAAGLPQRAYQPAALSASAYRAVAEQFAGAGDYQSAVRIGAMAPAMAAPGTTGVLDLWDTLHAQPSTRARWSEPERASALRTGRILLDKGYGPDATRLQLNLLGPQSRDWEGLWQPVRRTMHYAPLVSSFGSSAGDSGGDSGSGPPDREIVVTGHDPLQKLVTAFQPNASYELRFRVGAPAAGNLAQGDREVDVPAAGLKTKWIVSSTNVDFVKVSTGELEQRNGTWQARFDLDIPGAGESETVSLFLRTRAELGSLDLTILAGGEPYRSLAIRLPDGAKPQDDIVLVDPAHTNLQPAHEWLTPPEHFVVCVSGGVASIVTISGSEDPQTADWDADSTVLRNPIVKARAALDALRVAWDAHLNDLDEAGLQARLFGGKWMNGIHPGVGWSKLDNDADDDHKKAFEQLAAGDKLFKLAQAGYDLFNSCFPDGNGLRQMLGDLQPGSRVDFNWTRKLSPDNWIPHVPWTLMYLDPPERGKPVDCERFLGLRYRIGGRSFEWAQMNGSRALGERAKVNLLNFLYWGSNPADEIGRQSAWQRTAFAPWGNQRFIPSDPKAADAKDQVLNALESPTPDPAVVLYFFCECSVQDGTDPTLQFSDTGKLPNVVGPGEFPQQKLRANPLVFANACTTLGNPNPQWANELEKTFFQRNIRAFIGTETKVPVTLASRFAWLFFQFFLSMADPEGKPMSAGEALAQARLFLWTQYRNPGGLFYSLVNQYDLYLASSEEVSGMQRKRQMGAESK